MAKRRGAKPDYVVHPETGGPIEGLYANKDKRGKIRFYYYLDNKGKQNSCTSDIREAIKRYNAYKEKNKFPDLIEVPEEAKTIPIGQYGGYIDDDHVNKNWIIEQFQKILDEDRKLVVDVSGNSNYWDFENTPARPQSLTCQKVLDEYLNLSRKKPLNQDYRYKMIRHWKQFKSIVSKTFIRDIVFLDVKKYRDAIGNEAEKKFDSKIIKRKDLYINERFSAIHDIPSKIRATQEYKRDIDILLEHIGQLIHFEKDKIRVKAITPEQWDILYRHSANNLFIRCGLLLGINCAMTWGDIITLKLDNFDFKNMDYIGTRSKNNIQNCAKLFPETKKYLMKYIKHHPNKKMPIFYYKDVTAKTLMDEILRNFKEWKETLPKREFKKVENITQKSLRKSLRTTAVKEKCHIEYIKLVMGRKLEGPEEHYTEKDAIMTSEVIESVYNYYFPKTKKK